MIDTLLLNTPENAYISIAVVHTADGKYKVEDIKKLRDLSDEVRRIYEAGSLENEEPRGVLWRIAWIAQGENGVVIDVWDGRSSHIRIAAATMLDDSKLCALQKAHERLLAVEKAVAECDEHTVLFFGGETVQRLRVLDCQHADGSVYSWYIKEEDTTEYKSGDFVEVEHLGNWKNDYVKVVSVREINPALEDTPACPVVGLALGYATVVL